MSRVEEARKYFSQGYSCSQAILAAFGPSYGLPVDLALKLGRPLGAGMGMGDICGAVSGAFLVLGIQIDSCGDERKACYKSYDLVREFVTRFKMKHGSIICLDLLEGIDLGTESGRKAAIAQNLFTTICPNFVGSAAEVLDDMLKNAG